MFPFSQTRRRAARQHRRTEVTTLKRALADQRGRLRAARQALTAAAAGRDASAAELSRHRRIRPHRRTLLAAVVVPTAMLAAAHLLFGLLSLAQPVARHYWTLTGPTFIAAALVSVILTVIGVRLAAVHGQQMHAVQTDAREGAAAYDAAAADVTDLEQQVHTSAAALRDRKRR